MLRDQFVGKVLFEFLQVKPEDLFCLQWNAAEQGFDVSLISSGVFERLKLECQGKADEEPLSAFKVFSLERKNLKIGWVARTLVVEERRTLPPKAIWRIAASYTKVFCLGEVARLYVMNTRSRLLYY